MSLFPLIPPSPACPTVAAVDDDLTDAWQVTFLVPAAAVEAAEAAAFAASDPPPAIAAFAVAPGPFWRIEITSAEKPEMARLRRALEEVAKVHAFTLNGLGVRPLPARDWVAESQQLLPAFRAGRFRVHGAHSAVEAAGGGLALLVEAGRAFGTGHHGSTLGSLAAIDAILKPKSGARRIRNALDLGTGSGILAVAIAKAARCTVLATDIDPVATHVARETVRANSVAPFVHIHTAHGVEHWAIRESAPFDLVVANILAEPLIEMAPAIAALVRSGGDLVLSGLLAHQGQAVRARYRALGLVLRRRIVREGWLTLILERRRVAVAARDCGGP